MPCEEVRGLSCGERLHFASLGYQEGRHSDKLVFGLLLASPLDVLRKRGLNVDRFEQELAFSREQAREGALISLQALARGAICRSRTRELLAQASCSLPPSQTATYRKRM